MSIHKRIFFIFSGLVCASIAIPPSYAQMSYPQAQPTAIQETQKPYQRIETSPETISIPIVIVSAMLVIFLGFSKEIFSKRFMSVSSALEAERINEIAGLVKAESEREKTAIIRVITERSSSEDAILEIREKLKGIELESAEANKPIKSAIEGLVKSYHSQALSQSGIQFYFSVAAATVGFGLIIYAGMSAVNTDNPRKLLNTLPGAVISGVSVLFFKQAEETRKRATDLYDRLRSDERQSQAITIANAIESQEFRSLVQAQLVLHLADVKDTKPIDLGSQVSKLIILKDLFHNEKTENTKE